MDDPHNNQLKGEDHVLVLYLGEGDQKNVQD